MKYVIALIAAAAVLAAACGGSGPDAQTGDELSTAIARSREPQPVGEVPFGSLLVQRESSGYPTTYAISGGDVRELSKGPQVSVSPGGGHVAVRELDVDQRRYVLRVLDADGGETFRAEAPEGTSGSGTQVYMPVLWSADGSRLAYALPERAGTDAVLLFVVNGDGSEARQITSAAGYDYPIGWTGDGRVLVHGDEGLVLMGAKCQALPFPEGQQVYGELQMSPDGLYVAYLAGDWEEGFEVWALEVATGESRLVADMGQVARPSRAGLYVSAGIPIGVEPADDDDPLFKGPPPVIWSPDSRRIAYTRSESNADGEATFELHVADVVTGRDTAVAAGYKQGVWSPDGRYLAQPANNEGKVFLFGPDGKTRELDVQGQQAFWTADGTLITGNTGGIRLVEPETGAVREVLTAEGDPVRGADLWQTAWSPDGRYLAFATGTDDPVGQSTGPLYVLDTQTGGLTLILDGGSFQPVGWLSG